MGPSRCRSVAEGDRWARAQAAFVEFVLFLVPPDASKISVPPRLREIPTARHPRPPHIARIDYDNEHRCTEHEHDPIPFP